MVASKDGTLFEPDKIGEWDAFAFYTTGNLNISGTDKAPSISADGEKALYRHFRDQHVHRAQRAARRFRIG